MSRPILVRPSPTTFRRYKPEEMSGPLPDTLFKVLPEIYARRLVEEGEMQWSTLTWFQNEEDVQQGDAFEGSHRYFPVVGLEGNRLERGGRPDDARFSLPSHGLVSKAAQAHHIFIFSMTFDSALAIGKASSRACVEIFDPVTLVQRIRDEIKRPETLIHNEVKYWAPENPPENIWALPDRLTMHKHESFRDQREYRFAFGTRANVFDYENVQCYVVEKDYRWPRLDLTRQVHALRMRLRLGNLEDCSRVLPAPEFTSVFTSTASGHEKVGGAARI